MLASPNRLQTARLGLVISKKNVKRAVQRNRIKRQIRERFRQFPQREGPELDLSGLDIIVLARKGADGLSSQRIAKKVGRHFRSLARKAAEDPVGVLAEEPAEKTVEEPAKKPANSPTSAKQA